MKTRLKTRILRFTISNALLAALVLISPKLGAQDNSGFVVDKIIAKVDNYIILKSELEGSYQNYLLDGNPPSEDAKCGLLNRLVVNKLMVAKAEIDSVVVTDEEVDQNTTRRMQLILQNSGNSPEELERAYGKTMDEIRLDLRDQIREQMLGNEMTSIITKDISVTPAEVKRFFNKIPEDSLPYYSSDVEVAQIVRIVKVSDEQKAETKSKLMDLREQILHEQILMSWLENIQKIQAHNIMEEKWAMLVGGQWCLVTRPTHLE